MRLSQVHTPTVCETAHLASGISHWHFRRFELYRVNPPLVRMVAAVPVLAMNHKTDWSGFSTSPGARSEFRVGRDFIEANGSSSFRLFMFARWSCIFFSVLGGYVCFSWARSLWGTAGGVISLLVRCFDPNILGNASTIQPDAPAAAMAVTVAYLFRHWCSEPSIPKCMLTGVALGAALLTKTTLALLVPLLPLLWLIDNAGRKGPSSISFTHALGHISLIIALGVYILNLGYFFDGSFQRLDKFDFVSATLQGDTSLQSNCFAGTCFGSFPVPLPKDYVLGLDEQKRDFEGGLTSYLVGSTSHTGWWYFYLYGMSVKLPLGTLLLLGIAGVSLMLFGTGQAGRHSLCFVAVPAIAILVVVSAFTGMTQHVRYVLPVFPFLFILIGSAGRTLDHMRPRAMAMASVLALSWMVASSIAIFPHCHSYFNELAGGPQKGHFHLLSSNVDYGEDLFFLRDWLREHQADRPLCLAYFGNFDPRIAGIQFSLPPKDPRPGLHAISVNYLHGPSLPLYDGSGGRSYGEDYSYFLSFRPTARAGYGILIYDLDAEDVGQVHHRLGLPPLDWRRNQDNNRL